MFTKKDQAETLLKDKPSGDNRPVAIIAINIQSLFAAFVAILFKYVN